jgi:DNA (cytosine-5)-methyltransferase 1
MEATLRRLGYQVEKRLLSPHKFGVPQIRDRLFVVASKDGLDDFLWPEGDGSVPSLRTVLDPPAPGARQLSQAALDCLAVWQDFLNRSAHLEQLPSFPIWSMEFGATYPYEHVTPSKLSSHRLGQHLGAFGQPLCGLPRDKKIELLPPYARSEEQSFPAWKVDFIRQNRTFYSQNKKWIDPWLPSIRRFPNSLQKFEWNCKGEARDVWSTIIQFRASGVRVKRPSTAPSLVAMTTTQVPIIGWERRFMTPLECARLQSLDSLAELPSTSTRAFKALGNAVNAKLVELVAGKLLSTGKVTSSPKTAIAAA